jgi:hypothetical protein
VSGGNASFLRTEAFISAREESGGEVRGRGGGQGRGRTSEKPIKGTVIWSVIGDSGTVCIPLALPSTVHGRRKKGRTLRVQRKRVGLFLVRSIGVSKSI